MTNSEVCPTTGSIRTAVTSDLPYIQEWLKHEIRHGAGFINNWYMIQDACAKKLMTVFVDAQGPVGFLTYVQRDGSQGGGRTCRRYGFQPGKLAIRHLQRKSLE